MMPMPTKSGTSALGLPSSKCLRYSAARSSCSAFHWSVGPPLSRMTVSCASSGLRFRSQTAPRVPTALHTYLSVYHRSVRFHVT